MLFVFQIGWLSAQDANEDILASRIQNIENNLLPSLVTITEGERPSAWNIYERMEHYKVPGVSIVFFDHGTIQWTKCYGQIDQDRSTPVNAKTLFQAASISKPIAAVGALTLVEEGKLDLESPVNEFLKSWKLPQNKYTEAEAVTIKHLMTHTGGISVTGFDGYSIDQSIPSLVQILDGIGPVNSEPIRSDTMPGAIWKYSGGGFTILQQLMIDVTNKPFEDYFEQKIFSEVGMKRSFFQQPLPVQLHDNAAAGHRGNGEPVRGNWHVYPEKAAAGLWTTPTDLALLAIALQKAASGNSKQVIQPETAQTLFTNYKNNWGLGFSLVEGEERRWFTHGGANQGYRCTLLASIDGGPGVVIMTNGNNGDRLYTEILRSLSQEYDWDIFNIKEKQAVRLSAAEQSPYQGEYTHLPDPQYVVSVEMKGEELWVTQKWNDINFPIAAENKQQFFEKNEGVPFEFKYDEKGTVQELVIAGGWVLTKTK